MYAVTIPAIVRGKTSSSGCANAEVDTNPITTIKLYGIRLRFCGLLKERAFNVCCHYPAWKRNIAPLWNVTWLNDAAEKRKVNYSQILQSALKDYLGIYHP